MQIYGAVKCHLTLNVRKASKIRSPPPPPPSSLIQNESCIKVIGWSFERWDVTSFVSSNIPGKSG